MSTITTIQESDAISNSRSDINTNFSNLNTDKVEIGGTNGTPTRGDLVTGQNASPTWEKLTLGASGTILRSDGTDLSYTTATYPATTTVNQLLYSSSANAITGLATANNGVLITSGTGVPSISTTIPTATQNNITRLGTITSGTWQGTTIAVNQGGTGQTSYTNGQLLIGNTTGNTLTKATLTGTTNEIDITNGNGSIEIGISSSYVGGSSITTLGTIVTGTWQATDVGIAHGGTGASTAANARTNLGLVAGGAGDIWVEKAGDTMIGALTINQGSADNEILILKSSDVAHGITNEAETDTYFSAQKQSATQGGTFIKSLTEGGLAFNLNADYTTDDTAKTTSALGACLIAARKKSGTGLASPGADANLMTIRANTSTRFIFDNEGSAHADIEWVTYDTHDDVALLDTLDTKMNKRDKVTNSFGEFLKYGQKDLQEAKIVNFYDKNSKRAMVNFTRLNMLQVGAIRQLYRHIKEQGKVINILQNQLNKVLIEKTT